MNRKNFLKAMLGIAIAPKLLTEIKPRPLYFRKEFAMGFTVTKEMLEDDSMYHVDKNAWFMLPKLEGHERFWDFDTNTFYYRKINS